MYQTVSIYGDMKKGLETKERITGRALELFHSRGYHSTSMNDIMEITGVKKGNLYFHYSSKEELALDVLKEALKIYEDFISSRISGNDYYSRLCSLVDAVVEFHVTGGDGRGCIFGNMALESGGSGSALAEFTAGVFRGWERNIAGLISRGADSGEFRLGETPGELARVITAQLEGGIMLSKLYSGYEPLRESAGFIKSALRERLKAR